MAQIVSNDPNDAMNIISDPNWDLVLRRQPAPFLYAVPSMGIYCRTVCPSPRPRPGNVRYFADAPAAEAAGFRACKRCDPKGIRAALARAVVEDACAAIAASDTIPLLEALATRAGYSRFHFLRMFRDHTGLTPRAYAEGLRARKLQSALVGGARVIDAINDAGYGSESRVYEDTGKLLGMTPGALRRGGQGETIRSARAGSPFGRLLIAATGTGICFIGFGEPDIALDTDLRRRFPRAAIVPDDAGLTAELSAVIRAMVEPVDGISLPLDIRGTAFQLRVWKALITIPGGQTRSYGEVALMIGAPKATRAVATACAANPVALAVPCHRVIGSDGHMHGYRWGVTRKQALLAAEAQSVR